MKRKGIRVGIAVVVLAVLAGVFWYNAYYRGNLLIGLHTPQAEALADTLAQQCQAVEDVKLEYRAMGYLKISCYGEDLELEQVRELLDTIGETVQSQDFLADYTQAYDKRYRTQGSALEYVEVQVYRANTMAPDFSYNATLPFQQWNDLS